MNGSEYVIQRSVFGAERLISEHPPIWRDRNKRVVFDVACPAGRAHRGELICSRWKAMPLPDSIASSKGTGTLECREDVFDYKPVTEGAIEWHVNFADPNLFVAYGSGLFAQDEMQVLEHPILGALKEALNASDTPAKTEEDGKPTPILIMGAERRCRVATDRNPNEGRPNGLYGNAFARASMEAVRNATRLIDPPTVTNLIAIAAPSGGHGKYKRSEIERILTVAYSGFKAAVFESEEGKAVVHTGFWGCGAFGGNRVLMSMLQVIAAEMAGVERVMFHAFDTAGRKSFDMAQQCLAAAFAEKTVDTTDLIDRIHALGFEWGVSDGN